MSEEDRLATTGLLNRLTWRRNFGDAVVLANYGGGEGGASVPVAKREINDFGIDDGRIAEMLKAKEISAVARRVYVPSTDPLSDLAVLLGYRTGPSALSPSMLAEALRIQEGFRLAVGVPTARFLCLDGQRPTTTSEFGWDGGHVRRCRSLTMRPVPAALAEMSVGCQVLLLGLRRIVEGASVRGLEEHGRQMAKHGAWGMPPMRKGLDDPSLPEPHRIVASALQDELKSVDLHAFKAERRAPSSWLPPASDRDVPRVEGWRVAIFDKGNGATFECLRGRPVNHPYASSDKFRSSPLLWIDGKAGWALTESRLYRLGEPDVQSRGERA